MTIMNITENKHGNKYTFVLDGNLDTTTAPILEDKFVNITDEISEIVFDFTKLNYISSAGLRTILSASEIIGEDGVITVKGANPMVTDILDTTGFSTLVNMI